MNRTLACSAALAAFIAMHLSGCGGGETTDQKTTPSTVAPAPAAPTATAPPSAATDDELVDPVLAWAEAEPEEGKAPLTVQFTADIDGGKPPLKYTWKFGDGSPDSSEANPKHTYDKAGSYRADLEVSDATGDEDSDYIEIEVQ